MPIENRTTTITGVFAEDASTTIPTTPISGESYRNTALTEAEANEGWKYKNIVDSADVNQVLFEVTKILKLIEALGILTWSALTDYEAGSYCLGTDGKIYRAKQATGPSTTALDPVNDSSNTYWEDYFGKNFVTIGTTQQITGDKEVSGEFVKSGNTNPEIDIKISNYTKGTNPSATTYGHLRIVDGAGQQLGNIYKRIDTNGDSSMRFLTENKDGSQSARFDIGFKGDGSFYTYLPACDLASSIVTTTAISKTKNGHVKLGNGIIIQWGLAATASGTGTKQVSLPTAFSNTNYEVVVTGVQTSYSNDYVGAVEVISQTSSNFTIYSCGYSQARWIAIGY